MYLIVLKNFLLFFNQQFSFSAKNEYKFAAERRAAARREAKESLPNPDWRCILNIARTNFRPRPPAAGSGQAARLRRILSELPKNRKNIVSNRILLVI